MNSDCNLSLLISVIKLYIKELTIQPKLTIMKTFRTGFLYALMIVTMFTGCKKEEDPFEKDSGVFTDTRDQNKYDWIKMGDQIWMAENLAYDAGNGCWVYNDDEINVITMGRLYTWEAAQDACPEGWHLPPDIEWEELA